MGLDKMHIMCMSEAEKHKPESTALQKGKDMIFLRAVNLVPLIQSREAAKAGHIFGICAPFCCGKGAFLHPEEMNDWKLKSRRRSWTALP